MEKKKKKKKPIVGLNPKGYPIPRGSSIQTCYTSHHTPPVELKTERNSGLICASTWAVNPTKPFLETLRTTDTRSGNWQVATDSTTKAVKYEAQQDIKVALLQIHNFNPQLHNYPKG